MKYILLFLLFTIGINAQTFYKANVKGTGVSWADSLFSTHADSGLYHLPNAAYGDSVASDTSKTYFIDKSFSWYALTVYDSSSTGDSLYIWLGQIVNKDNGGAADTLWNLAKIKDSTWSLIDQPVVNAGEVTTYTVYEPESMLIAVS